MAAPRLAHRFEGVVPFPSVRLRSEAEFADYERLHEPVLADRYLYERSLASSAPSFTMAGTCQACRLPTTFVATTDGGEHLGDGRRVPNWRETLTSGCCGQTSRLRAMLHFLETVAELRPWCRLLVFGDTSSADALLMARARQARWIQRLSVVGTGRTPRYRMPAESASAELVLSPDHLSKVPPLDAAISESHRVLVPGGRFVFTVPFYFRAAKTVSRIVRPPRSGMPPPTLAGGDVHAIGWDILDRIRLAGFADAAAHTYWTEELGYLGAHNMIFVAHK